MTYYLDTQVYCMDCNNLQLLNEAHIEPKIYFCDKLKRNISEPKKMFCSYAIKKEKKQ